MPQELINSALAFISNKFEDLKKSFNVSSKSQTGILENIRGEIESQTEKLELAISKLDKKDRSAVNALESMVSELSEVVSKLGRKEGNVVSSLDQLISEINELGNKVGIEINLNPLLTELTKQRSLLEKIENKKEGHEEIMQSNELLQQILNESQNNKIDLSGLKDMKTSFISFGKDIKTRIASIESMLGKIERGFEKTMDTKIKMPNSFQIDQRQFKELAASMRLGGGGTQIHGESNSNIRTGRQTSSTPGTAVQLSSTPDMINKIVVQAIDTNANLIVVGDSSVVAASGSVRGTMLQPGDAETIYVDDLQKVYIDVRASGDGVTYTAYS